MFAFEFDLHMRIMPFVEAIFPIALAMLIIELGLIIAVIVGRNDHLKSRHRIILLFGVSILVCIVGQTCGAISEFKARRDLDEYIITVGGALDESADVPVFMRASTNFVDEINHIEQHYRFVQSLYNIIAIFGLGASLLFWTFMRRGLGFDQSTSPWTL